ncbi:MULTISPECIES: hypothetical protein [unclassified Saccharopolyspora]|uniref:hypothetical protein n=1 Tax=unclassified Saccharopolyspora TaxID=2646250 RepID=UPI001CD5174B|nr:MULTISPECIES: hypothetical protein [unclassified Saccharopolyspora]MCA1228864.1 hypothetical protein [Saccharopolyspora sp. 6M]MCA1282606.1 hypothetical protein [Saccharopolyspora sp. 7B]
MDPKDAAPAAVRSSIIAWTCAVAAGVAETVLQVVRLVAAGAPAGGLAGQLVLRGAVYAAVLVLVLRLRRGGNGVRIAVAVLVGGLGTASMVGPPIAEVLGGVPVEQAFLNGTGPWAWTFAALRAAHLVAVCTGLVLLFAPASNAHFRAAGAAAGRP